MNKRTIAGIAVFCVVIALGAGCMKKEVVTEEKGVDLEMLATLSPEEAANAITFKDGSSFVITQRATLHEGRIVAEEESLNTRTVEVASFDRISGALSWTQVQDIPTVSSLTRRDAFVSEEHEEGEEAPPLTFEEVRAEGTLQAIELMESHELMLPAGWTSDEVHARSSAVWLSEEAFLELSRTRTSTIYMKAIETANMATLGSTELQVVVNGLREHVRDISESVEVDAMKAEGDVVEVPLTVNGKEIRVQAIKARNWFGEMVVLDNPENPLILKFDFNPSMEGIEAGSEEMNLIKGILSFEIPEVTL